MHHHLPLQSSVTSDREIRVRQPTFLDGTAVHRLVGQCPPLDANSLYCNLLQCSVFSSTCVIAEQADQPVGFVSAFVLPEARDTLFIWQVAVAPEARGIGLAHNMVLELLARPACASISQLQTTITPGNDASWALFGSVSKTLNATMSSHVHFDRKQHFNDQHDSELLVTIGRFAPCAITSASLKFQLKHLT